MAGINLKNIENIITEFGQNKVIEIKPGQVSEYIPHNTEDYDKIEDNFIRYRMMVNDAVELYERARLLASVSDTGLSASIFRMAEPFRKGHFTLAVVGKMSAGKSTFINALLGDKDLLPTGYFQTTCTLTTIRHSENKILHVIYGDSREEEISENIGEALVRLVAIEPRYNSLPVNNVNRLILNNIPKDKICSEQLIQELESVSKNKIDINLLKEYVTTHPKEKIPMEVAIECPLSEEYRGWRIVDTPGVDAVGGIEDDTRKFLCGKDEDGNHNVDAIIFIQAAKGEMQSKSLNEFVNDTIDNLTEEAKKRAFFVLTHATNPDFMTRRDEVMSLAKQLFIDYAGVGDESRLIAVDSLAALLGNDLQLDYRALVKASTPAPSHWDADVWKDCRTLLRQVKNLLEEDEEVEFNNENARYKLHELANLETFRNYLNVFVKQEKNKAFCEIIEMIEQDINACIDIRQKDIRILKTNLGKSPQDFLKKLNEEKEKLDQFQQDINLKFKDLRNNYGKSQVDKKFQEKGLVNITPDVFKSLPSLKKMREKAETLGDRAKKVASSIKYDITKDINNFVVVSQKNKEFVLPPIDYKDIASRIEKKADEDSDRTRQEKRRKATTETGLYIRKRIGDFFGTDWGYEVWYETVHYTDMDEAAASFCKYLMNELNKYRSQIAEQLEKQMDLIDTDIKPAIRKRKDDYDAMAKNASLANQITQKEREIKHLQTAIDYLRVYHL